MIFRRSLFRLRQAFLLLLISGLTVTATCQAAEPPRWKFKQGDTTQYVTRRTSDVKLDLSGSVLEFGFISTFDSTWKVKSVAADGSAELEQTIDRLQIKAETPLGSGFDYDSKVPGSGRGPMWEAVGPLWESMVGDAFTLKVTPLGKVTEITLPKKLLAELAKPPSPARLSSMSGIGGDLNVASIKETIERSILLLPDRLDGANTSWSQVFERKQATDGKGEILQKRTFDYSLGKESKHEGHTVQQIVRKLTLELKASPDATIDTEVVEQEGEETFDFDVDAGRIVNAAGRHRSVVETTGANRPETAIERDERFEIRLGTSADASKTSEPAPSNKSAE